MGLLRCHPHFVGRALHAAFDNMRHTELLADFAEIARRAAFILHNARPADHFQVGNPDQMSQDLVLHALGEEGVRFLFAQIFEGKDRDAFFHGSSERPSRYCSVARTVSLSVCSCSLCSLMSNFE
jgi:hypothetical protein